MSKTIIIQTQKNRNSRKIVLKTDQLHTSLTNKESLSHRLRHRRNQQVPPTTNISLTNISWSHRQFRLPTGTRDPGLIYSKYQKLYVFEKVSKTSPRSSRTCSQSVRDYKLQTLVDWPRRAR